MASMFVDPIAKPHGTRDCGVSIAHPQSVLGALKVRLNFLLIGIARLTIRRIGKGQRAKD